MSLVWSYDAVLVGASDAGSIPASSTTMGLIGFDDKIKNVLNELSTDQEETE